MEKESNLPFKVGEMVEARSFQIGYRGAWFRCKIREIRKRKGHVIHALECFDFPDEKLKLTKLYQVPWNYAGKPKGKQRELMVRPCYPPIYDENQIPLAREFSKVMVNVDAWEVGDLVDWWTTDCYWSGRITQLLGDDKAQIELNPPPHGEGASYKVLLKDLRPSLNWSPEYGWTVPTQNGDTGCPRARLIKPVIEGTGSLPSLDTHKAGQEIKACQGTNGSSSKLSPSSPIFSNSLAVSKKMKRTGTMEMQKQSLRNIVFKEVMDTQETIISPDSRDSRARKTSRMNTDSSTHIREMSGGSAAEVARRGGITLNSIRSDTLEAAILDLEELVNKVKWIKANLMYGISFSDSPRPQWEFVENHAASSMHEVNSSRI